MICMADLICDMNDCKYRSRRPLRKWRRKDKSPCYGCTQRFVVITCVFDPDGDIEAVGDKENMAHCCFYESIDKENLK